MRVWVDVANSPHVPLLVPIVERLREEGDDVLVTARDHAQTVELARDAWPDLVVVGGESPAGRFAKGLAVARRAWALRGLAKTRRPDVAFSHGSYAQAVAGRLARVGVVTMMDYEHQPANHLSFRLARTVIVPRVFPEASLKRFGARHVVRYEGFKEDLYLGGFEADPRVLRDLGIDRERPLAVFRPPPEGALYHRVANERFDPLVDAAVAAGAQVVLLPRTAEQRAAYADRAGVLVPDRAIDARSLLALADVVVGAGGTMNREGALLGTPTFTVFAGTPGAVDAELIRLGLLRDLRAGGDPVFERKVERERPSDSARGRAILSTVVAAIRAAA